MWFPSLLNQYNSACSQEGRQAGASVTPQQAAHPPQAAVEQTPANPPPFTFTAVGVVTSDSPQLHVPELQLGPQVGQDLRQAAGSQLQVEPTMMPTQTAYDAQRQDSAQTEQPQQQQQPHQQLQQQQQSPLLQQLAVPHGYSVAHSQTGPSPTAQAQLQMPAWAHQPLQYQYTSQAMLQSPQQAYTAPQQQQQQQSQPQVQGTVQAVQVASGNPSHVGSPAEQPTAVASNTYAPPPTQHAYPQLPGPAELGMPPGNQTESYGAVPRTVITSGAMGGDAWSRPNSRPVSPGNQRQVSQVL